MKIYRESSDLPAMLFYYRKIPLKYIIAHKCFICEPIFKIFVPFFTSNLMLNIVKKIICLPLKKL